jgi:threonyl-tRNA synthetase
VERYEESQLYRIRHSMAHVMAQAVLRVFPDAGLAIGPPIEDGFYYDFALPRTLTEEDLNRIAKEMKQIIKGGHDFVRREVGPDEALALFRQKGQDFKVELIEDLLKDGQGESLSTYTEGRM